MPSKRDDLKDSFFLYLMQTRIGATLRKEFALEEPLTDRLTELLKDLDEPADESSPSAPENSSDGAA
jgi:hypothetical protein